MLKDSLERQQIGEVEKQENGYDDGQYELHTSSCGGENGAASKMSIKRKPEFNVNVVLILTILNFKDFRGYSVEREK